MIRDHRLRLIFTCCHPQIPHDDRTLLALKTLCGFGIPEIASAFLASEAAEAALPKGTPDWLRAQDIAFQARAAIERQRKRK